MHSSSMYLSALSLLLTPFVSAAAIAPPPTLPDGVYHVDLNLDGHHLYTLLDPANEAGSVKNFTVKARSSVSLSRDDQNVWCGCGLQMNHDACNRGVDGLQNELRNQGNMMRARTGIITISQDMVTFAINGGAYDILLFNEVVANTLAYITRICGEYVPGTNAIGTIDIGYMNYFAGLDVAGAARASDRHSC